MKSNLPVTGQEKRFPEHAKLISATDLNGIITDCNEDFIAVSGYSRDELIGQPHNLVRHPDMPEAAFAIMWQHLRDGKPWMGLVKNRCKNGDHYWVDAYVTPVTVSGQVVGYESVRRCPERQHVRKATQVYSASPSSNAFCTAGRSLLLVLLAALLLLVLGQALQAPLHILLYVEFALLAGYLIHRHQRSARRIEQLQQLLGNAFMHPLAAKTYSESRDELASIEVGIRSLQAHLFTALTRIERASSQVSDQSEKGLHSTEKIESEIRGLCDQSQQAASAMRQMAEAINEVAAGVQSAASAADETASLAKTSGQIAVNASQAIADLRNTVLQIGEEVRQFNDKTQQISTAANLIEQIADQTSLLALNAAIEAARAAHHGKGFAVVADEVRNLAARTAESTTLIHTIASQLMQLSHSSAVVVNQGCSAAHEGVTRVTEVEQALIQISTAMDAIANQTEQMAAAVEEQARVSDEVNLIVTNNTRSGMDVLDQACSAAANMQRMKAISGDLHELVRRFSST